MKNYWKINTTNHENVTYPFLDNAFSIYPDNILVILSKYNLSYSKESN